MNSPRRTFHRLSRRRARALRAVRHDRRLDLALALIVLVAGLAEAVMGVRHNTFPQRGAVVPAIVATAAAIGCARRRPELALGLFWLVCIVQAAAGLPLLAVEIALVAVLFIAARRGRKPIVVSAAVSIPAAAALAYPRLGAEGALLVVVLAGVCWTAGLTVRAFEERSARSLALQLAAEADVAQAHRDGDAVDRTLSAILAKAEPAHPAAEPDAAALKSSMAAIAELARASLRTRTAHHEADTEPLTGRAGRGADRAHR